MVLLLLAGGAIINVAVAWGCAIRSVVGPPALDAVSANDFAEIVTAYSPTDWKPFDPSARGMSYFDELVSHPLRMKLGRLFVPNAELRSFGLVEQHIAGKREYQNPTGKTSVEEFLETEEIVRLRAGWPTPTFETGGSTGSSEPLTMTPSHAWILPPTNSGGYDRWVPYKPLWPGFAINATFYAAILWLLFAAPFALRRRIRIKRGQCPVCAYPIGSSDACTECGHHVDPRCVAIVELLQP